LFHAAGQFVRVPVGEPGQPNQIEELPGPVGAFAAGHALGFQAELHIGLCGAPRQQRVLLEHDPPVQARPGHRRPVEEDLTGRGLAKAGQQVQQCGLAAATGPDQDQELTTVDVEADAVQGGHPPASRREDLPDTLEADLRGHGRSPRCSSSTAAGCRPRYGPAP
jgi:hypothetical protein